MGLGAGSGRPGAPQTVGDYTIAGVATRVIAYSGPPLDVDWGPEGAPNGTIVFESDGILWVKLGGTWVSTVLG